MDTGGSTLLAISPISEASWLAVIADPDGNVIGLYEGGTITTD